MSSEQQKWREQHDARFLHGTRLYASNNFGKALQHFAEMLLDYPDSTGALMYLGAINFRLGKIKRAIHYGLRATQVCPYSELSSVTLHYALKAAEQRREAFIEMERFYNAPMARPTPELYGDYVDGVACDMELEPLDYPDKRDLVRRLVEVLDEEGFLEQGAMREWTDRPSHLWRTLPFRIVQGECKSLLDDSHFLQHAPEFTTTNTHQKF